MNRDLPAALPVLLTARLRLRPVRETDRASHFRLHADADTARFLYNEPLTLDTQEAHFAARSTTRFPGDTEWGSLVIETRDDERFLGEMAFHLASITHSQVEVGYVLTHEARGHGYATEATTALIAFAFDVVGAHRVSGRLDARNERSARVLERVGMKREAHLRENEFVKGEWTDEVVYGVLEREWRARLAHGH